MRDQIRTLVEAHVDGGLATPSAEADLWAAGLTSLGATRVLMDIEDHFDIELEPELLTKTTFGSIEALVAAVTSTLGTTEQPVSA